MKPLPKIPRGWRLVPLGCKIRYGDMVSCNPHKKWIPVSGGRFSLVGCTVNQTDAGYIPFGYYTVTGRDFGRAIGWARKQTNPITERLKSMKTYQCTMSSGATERVNSHNAADAIQSALMKHVGSTVTKCSMRDMSGNGMDFDIPPHKALTREDVERLNPRREREAKPQSYEVPIPQRAAPWMEEWAARKGVKL